MKIKPLKHVAKSFSHLILHLILQSSHLWSIHLSNDITIALNVIIIATDPIGIPFDIIGSPIYLILYPYPGVVRTIDGVVARGAFVVVAVVVDYYFRGDEMEEEGEEGEGEGEGEG